jgi:uncharacterized protein YciI
MSLPRWGTGNLVLGVRGGARAGQPAWQDGRRAVQVPGRGRGGGLDGGAMPVFGVTTARHTGWDHARDIREQPWWDQHAAFADELVERGVIILGGPIGGGDGEDLALLAVEAADEDAVRSIFDADPWTIHQVFRIKQIRPWTLWLDGRPRKALPARDSHRPLPQRRLAPDICRPLPPLCAQWGGQRCCQRAVQNG